MTFEIQPENLSEKPIHTFSLQSVGFPNPYPSQFMIYLLQFCPAQTSTCFGSGNLLKQTDGIPAPPNDLDVVSKMLCEWTFQGQVNLVIFTSFVIPIASDVNNESSSQVALVLLIQIFNLTCSYSTIAISEKPLVVCKNSFLLLCLRTYCFV